MILTEKDLINLAEDNPKKVWEIFETQGYDLSFELAAYRTLEESKHHELMKFDQERLLKLITVDI